MRHKNTDCLKALLFGRFSLNRHSDRETSRDIDHKNGTYSNIVENADKEKPNFQPFKTPLE
jgi:hypothetical protein